MVGKPNKTQATRITVKTFLSAVPQPRRGEADALCAMMARVSGETACMWGPSIIGFGERRYRYDSGREGVICKIGFSPRKPATVLYGLGLASDPDGVAELGKVSTGKGCIYVKHLADIDLGRLEQLLQRAVTKPSS